MRSASRQLVKKAIKDGWTFEIMYYGDTELKSNKFKEVITLINDIDDDIEIHLTKDGEKDDWCNIIIGGVAPDEEISDCYVGGYIDRWCTLTDFGQKDYEGVV